MAERRAHQAQAEKSKDGSRDGRPAGGDSGR
jgi:hypothetical protein